jgi:hypothetical protein
LKGERFAGCMNRSRGNTRSKCKAKEREQGPTKPRWRHARRGSCRNFLHHRHHQCWITSSTTRP